MAFVSFRGLLVLSSHLHSFPIASTHFQQKVICIKDRRGDKELFTHCTGETSGHRAEPGRADEKIEKLISELSKMFSGFLLVYVLFGDDAMRSASVQNISSSSPAYLHIISARSTQKTLKLVLICLRGENVLMMMAGKVFLMLLT
jgi:hypothetical protein